MANFSEANPTLIALQRALDYTQAIVMTMPHPLMVIDDGARVVSANKAFLDAFHTSEDRTINRKFSELPDVRWSTPGIEKLLIQTVIEERNEIHEAQITASLRENPPLILNLSARRLEPGSGREPMLLICFEDITNRKRMEEERETLVEEFKEARVRLEGRVEERTLLLVQSLTRLREVSEQLVLAHESEQRRIARELHDQVGQDLTALRLIFNRASKNESNPARQIFQEAEKVTEEAIQNVRIICSTLRPQMLDDLGLIAALSGHVKNFGERSRIKIGFEHEGVDEKRLTPILQSAIFRVIQEGLTNVARHAKTDEATVVLWMTEKDVLFRIQDRGCGFKIDAAPRRSNGLFNMRERIHLINGECEIKSAPGRGTTIQALIPLTPHVS
jgi:PAS domain S-box-containing protein